MFTSAGPYPYLSQYTPLIELLEYLFQYLPTCAKISGLISLFLSAITASLYIQYVDGMDIEAFGLHTYRITLDRNRAILNTLDTYYPIYYLMHHHLVFMPTGRLENFESFRKGFFTYLH
jgi:hypothetical protein